MWRRDVAEGDGRAQGDAATWIIAAHNTRHVVANSVEAPDRLALSVEDLGVAVGAQPIESAEVAHHHLDGVERPTLDWGEARVGFEGGVAIEAVVGGRAFAESGVLAGMGVPVVGGDRLLQPIRVDAGRLRQLGERAAALEVARADLRSDRNGEGLNEAEAEAT